MNKWDEYIPCCLHICPRAHIYPLMISIHIDWSSRDRPQQTQKQTDVYIQHIITKSEKERDRSHSRKGTCSVSFRAIFVCLFFYCLLKITSAALISLYWHSDIQGAKRLLPWVVTYWRHCCPLNLRPLLLRNFGPKNNVIAKDFLLTGREQPCTRITRLFVCLVVAMPKMA